MNYMIFVTYYEEALTITRAQYLILEIVYIIEMCFIIVITSTRLTSIVKSGLKSIIYSSNLYPSDVVPLLLFVRNQITAIRQTLLVGHGAQGMREEKISQTEDESGKRNL